LQSNKVKVQLFPAGGVTIMQVGTMVRMKITSILILAVSLATTTNLATAAPSTNSNDDQMRALSKAVDDARSTFQKATNDADHELRGTYYHVLMETNLPRILDLANTNPASETAFEMCSWIVMKALAERGPIWTNRLQAVELLAKYQAANSRVGPLCGFIGHNWIWRWREKPVVDFLQAVVQNNPDRANRGQAIFSLGALNVCKAENLAEFERWGSVPFYAASIAKFDTTDLTQWGDSKSVADEAERQLEEVVENYADCWDLRPRDSKEKTLLKTEAEIELRQLLHFSLGKVAPEIEAESIEGKKFKLSDSRGKITVLSFWASWCGPCMQLVPVERALTERMKGKPFTLVGVNGDGILPDAQQAVAHEKMTWPSFWNGKDGAHGPISSAWNVSGWPAVYVLDANGIIRFKFEGFGEPAINMLNGSVDELMKEMVSPQK
jgi:thiol-disulfide isomerase/thioredoxin